MTANAFEPEWDAERDEPPFVWKRARLGRQAGARGTSARRCSRSPPAPPRSRCTPTSPTRSCSSCWPAGPRCARPSPRRELAPGDVVAFPAGEPGAHRLDNHGDEPARILIVSTMRAPEINLMYEQGQYWLRDYAPGTDPSGRRCSTFWTSQK